MATLNVPVPPSRSDRAASAPSLANTLENGDRLTRDEFERRYEARPDIKKAELIEGVVHMPSPTRSASHARPHAATITWLGSYAASTPGVQVNDNPTVRLDLDNEPQPDAALLIDPGAGGRARLSDDDSRTAERFEVFWAGLELANGYDELQDPEEHRRRFAAENRARERAGRPAAQPDERFLAALETPGLPRCSGVALGVDRLVMAAVGASQLDDVLAFRENPDN